MVDELTLARVSETDYPVPEEQGTPETLPCADCKTGWCRRIGREALPLTMPRAVAARPVPAGADLDHPTLYFNQELGDVDFNWRVLHLALDPDLPLLERVRFVAIAASNLDEFFQKRVGGLKRQEAAGVLQLSADGRTPTEQLELIRPAARCLQETMGQVWEKLLKPALREQAGIAICSYEELDPAEREALHTYFQNEVYPILSPLAVDPGRPFPFISNLSLSLAVISRYPGETTTRFARLKVPANLPRWLTLKARDAHHLRLLPLEELIAHHVDELFRGIQVVGVYPFRVTRNADLRRDEEEADDLLALISDELRRRRFATIVRLEVTRDMPDEVCRFLMDELELRRKDLYYIDGLVDLTGCFSIAQLDAGAFKFSRWEPGVPSPLWCPSGDKGVDLFAVLRHGDILVHHPYDSFTSSVQWLVEQAADDPHVQAIKQTIYRTSDESPIIDALIQAAENGKQVVVLVEVKARFDEANNIEWGRKLENAGVHVAYGLVGLKTHAKATLIVRREKEGLRTYCHIGTGNYHPKTALLYTDLGLLTADPHIGRDVVNLFHYLTGYAPGQTYDKIMVAPRDMRAAFYELIEGEILQQQGGGSGRIIAKMNALDDVGIIRALYRASQAGVQIDLIIRGHCTLRPGIPGYSDNIRVISILGRFLEHSRIFYFGNGGQPLVYIGSADWRNRNLEERVELIAPVEQADLKQQMREILDAALDDNDSAWDIDAEGQYTRRRPASNQDRRRLQESLMAQARLYDAGRHQE